MQKVTTLTTTLSCVINVGLTDGFYFKTSHELNDAAGLESLPIFCKFSLKVSNVRYEMYTVKKHLIDLIKM